MKPFKFRVWHKPSKTWVSTEIVLYHDGKVDMCTAYENLDITDNEDFEISYSTGLFDYKGNYFYTGCVFECFGERFILENENGYFECVNLNNQKRYYFGDFMTNGDEIIGRLRKISEIIGDKFENPELLNIK